MSNASTEIPTVHLEPHDVHALVRYINRDADGDPHAARELVGYLAAVLRQQGIKIPFDGDDRR